MTDEEWVLVVNFWAFNVSGIEVEVCQTMALLYGCPLKKSEIKAIAEFQKNKKRAA